jgi:NADH dehydrogenase/NADH:ubiquinone oxidoreductase subunit G
MGLFIDNKYFKFFNKKYTILQFCLLNGISIPFFCYHDLLSIAGNCRMCLVEVNTILVASCALPLNDNMVIFTNNYRIRLARESILEFLLVNHPLDCPICDQGGECDLQDIALVYGSDIGHFNRYLKRSVDNLNCCGPLIKTVMTRCIHCTRCVRFVNEISDKFDLGIIGRGNSMEIGTYIEKYIDDALIGNIIDLCPVGALTSMPYSFTSRA